MIKFNNQNWQCYVFKPQCCPILITGKFKSSSYPLSMMACMRLSCGSRSRNHCGLSCIMSSCPSTIWRALNWLNLQPRSMARRKWRSGIWEGGDLITFSLSVRFSHPHTHTHTHTHTPSHTHSPSHLLTHTPSHLLTHTPSHLLTHTPSHIYTHRHSLCYCLNFSHSPLSHYLILWKALSHYTLFY